MIKKILFILFFGLALNISAQAAKGVLNTEKTTQFSIHPNPGSDVLNISITTETTKDFKLEVFDVLGKKVYSQQLNKLSAKVNIVKWNSGLYLIRLMSPNLEVSLTKRFVKL